MRTHHLAYHPEIDVFALSLFGEQAPPTLSTVVGVSLSGLEVELLVQPTSGRLLGLAIRDARRWIPRKVRNNPTAASDSSPHWIAPDEIAFEFAPGGLEKGLVVDQIETRDHRLSVAGRRGRVVGMGVCDASKHLPPALLAMTPEPLG